MHASKLIWPHACEWIDLAVGRQTHVWVLAGAGGRALGADVLAGIGIELDDTRIKKDSDSDLEGY
jgi:hypothetical protein